MAPWEIECARDCRGSACQLCPDHAHTLATWYVRLQGSNPGRNRDVWVCHWHLGTYLHDPAVRVVGAVSLMPDWLD